MAKSRRRRTSRRAQAIPTHGGNSAEEAAQYEKYKRQEDRRRQAEEQARQEYEQQRKYQEDAAKAAAAQNNLGDTYPKEDEAAEPAPQPDAQSSAEPSPPPFDQAEITLGDGGGSPRPAPAPTTAPAPSGAADIEVVRHPTIDAPDQIVAGETVTVSIALTEEQLTPEVKVKAAPGSSVTEDGALAMAMPAGAEQWPIDIDLFASGFDLTDGGKWSRQTTLYRQGDSDFVRFDVKARPIAKDSKPAQFIVRIYSAGQFLGSASRSVTVRRTAPVEAAAPSATAERSATPAMLMLAPAPPQPAVTGDITLGGAGSDDVPGLDVTILYDDPSGLGSGQIIIHSPHLAGSGDRYVLDAA
ncbi:hypothetical protein JQK88_30515 [Mesorhizobium caraganae]|uniref:hypothetical protein n=1 Tax=Mesorhizobium caraganae TaxID=483206 RepID=UPI00193ACFE2|nr:hypothetical protein [Mesorhizobium caraganae]MBM2715464.1 hypothetical protein [Mesorhizobium caraganae]